MTHVMSKMLVWWIKPQQFRISISFAQMHKNVVDSVVCNCWIKQFRFECEQIIWTHSSLFCFLSENAAFIAHWIWTNVVKPVDNIFSWEKVWIICSNINNSQRGAIKMRDKTQVTSAHVSVSSLNNSWEKLSKNGINCATLFIVNKVTC